MNHLEWAAAGLGLVNILLVLRRSIWNYPFGIAMVGLYFFVFYDARLYSDALLQLFFLAIQLYGWWSWARARREQGKIVVGRLSPVARSAWLGATLAMSLVWGAGMARFTDAAAPFADAAIAGMSVAAQILLSLRKTENWILWVAVDALGIGLFASRALIATSALYAVFLVIAAGGLVAWRRAEIRQAQG